MERFAQLFSQLDASTSTNDKLAALTDYFNQTATQHPQDAAWALYFLAGGKPRQLIKSSLLKLWAQELAQIPDWLFEECYAAVGDLAETIALVVPTAPITLTATSDELQAVGLAQWVERLRSLKALDELQQSEQVKTWWGQLPSLQRFLLVKLVSGGFRVGISKLLVTRALATHAQLDAKLIAQRLMGYTDGKVIDTATLTTKFVAAISVDVLSGENFAANTGQPYPFFLAHSWQQPIEAMQSELGDSSSWLAEWKYDGIRAQIVKRAGQVHVWSRGEELMNGRFPEIETQAEQLPDGTVLDGEVLVFKNNLPQPFNLLAQRIGRKTLTKKILADVPVSFMVYDLLEDKGADIRALPQLERRNRLEALLGDKLFEGLDAHSNPKNGWLISPLLIADNWQQMAQQRTESRGRGVEGLMLKHAQAAYGQGRVEADGVWWKWKIDPLTVDCVLIYAQAGHGRRASLYTDYTFAVWSRPPHNAQEAQAVIDAIEKRQPAQPGALQLVAFAKAYSGLTDEEFKQVDAIVRKNTLEKFGPVRSVKPTLVFELGFEGINRSGRHKSGIAVRFPRMLRIRTDKPVHEAETLDGLQALLS